jgi:phosphoglycerate dehydrogenase-like enzyme
VEKQLIPEVVSSPIPLTNSRGVYKESLGEFVIAAILFFAKDLRRMLRQASEARWEAFDVEMITGRVLGIVGYGEIGAAVARRAKALDMTVYALRRRPQPEGDGIADRFFSPGELHDMIAQSHYIVLAAPLTRETRGLIGREEIARMRSDAVIINIGRGPVIEERALLEALQDRRIRGAALDVFDTEPLPADHPYWRLDNLLISPHCADHVDGWQESAVEFFVANFRRFESGEPLLNVVDKEAGY